MGEDEVEGGNPSEPASQPAPVAGSPNRGLRMAAIITAVIAVLAGTTAIALSTIKTGPPQSPEDAAQQLFDRLQAGDGLGVLATIAPADRDAVRQPLLDGVSELQRLGLISNVDPAKVRGMSISTDSLRFQRSPYQVNLAAVDVVAGRFTVKLEGEPGVFTPKGRDLSKELFHLDAKDGSFTRDFAQHPLRLVAVNGDDGGWYLSIPYTIAEAVRPRGPEGFEKSPGTTVNPGTAAPSSPGSPSPEDAVRQFATQLAAGDRAQTAAAVAPGEATMMEGAGFLFPAVNEHLPDPHRTGSIKKLELSADGTGSVRKVKVTRLEAEFATDVNRTDVTYDGRCFAATYRFLGVDEDYATYRTCNGEKTTIAIEGGNESEAAAGGDEEEREREEREREAKEEKEREGKTTAGSVPERDSFGQPIGDEGGEESVPVYRPLNDPFSALAVFGGGADLPTFTVVQQGNGWYVSPMRSVLDSTVDTLRATKPDHVEALLERIKQHTETAEAEAIVFEARDPDNALFGPVAVRNNPTLPLCFIEVRATAGGKAAFTLYNECVARLVEAGKIDPATVPPSQLFLDCVLEKPTSPPALDNPIRRAYFADKASRECFQRRLATAGGKLNVFDKVVTPSEPVPCFGPYEALARTAPESDWVAADAQVAACYRR